VGAREPGRPGGDEANGGYERSWAEGHCHGAPGLNKISYSGQWRAAKLAPKRYGDKLAQDMTVKHSLEDLILEARRKRATIEGRVVEALPGPSSMVTKDEASAD
jgi:hypothetical protein